MTYLKTHLMTPLQPQPIMLRTARPLSLTLLALLALPLPGCSKGSQASSGNQHAQASAKGSSGSASSSSGSSDQSSKDSQAGAQANDTVKITPSDQQLAGIAVAPVLVERVPQTLTVAGQVQLDEQHTSHLGTLADGRISDVSVLAGAPVHRDQTLGTLHSHMVHETVGSLVQAYAAVDRQQGAVAFAHQQQARYHHLYSIQAASLEESQRADQDLQQAEQMLRDAEASVHMEREHLSELLQVDPESLTPTNLYDRELVPIRSPINGVVVARNISVGQVVPTGFDAFDVSNLATVWVTAAVNQQDLALIHVGASAEITQTTGTTPGPGAAQNSSQNSSAGTPGNTPAHGQVANLGDLLDPTTRTIPVRLVVPNPGTRLRPGMFVTAHIAEPATRDAIFIPEQALQAINGMPVVFVTADGQTFQARTVTLGARVRGQAEVTQGLGPHDRVVVHGAFMVKSEMLKSTMGDG